MDYKPFPEYLFDPSTRHMLSVAHQDDEINYTGLIGRWGKDARFLWMTNGDGLAPSVNADPREYAELRKAETDAVLSTIGRPLEQRSCLDYSEIEIYDHFVELTLNPDNRDRVMDFMQRIGSDIYREIKAFMPDVVWVAQFQHGQPEHDLAHFLSAYAIRQIKQETGKDIKLFQLPEYEYTILIPMRFNPLYKGVVHHIRLTPDELEMKRRAIACYPSQVTLFDRFEKVMNRLGMLSRLVGKGFNAEEFLSTEYFSPVPEDMDYTKSFHHFEWANYMFDENKNVKIRFDRHIRPIAAEMATRRFG